MCDCFLTIFNNFFFLNSPSIVLFLLRDPSTEVLHVPWYEWARINHSNTERIEYITQLLQRGAGLTPEQAATVPGGVRLSRRTDGEDSADGWGSNCGDGDGEGKEWGEGNDGSYGGSGRGSRGRAGEYDPSRPMGGGGTKGGDGRATYAETTAAAKSAAESKVYPQGSDDDKDMGGMDAYVAKVESEAGTEVRWGRNGAITVTPMAGDDRGGGEGGASSSNNNNNVSSNDDNARGGILPSDSARSSAPSVAKGRAQARFVGGRKTSRLQQQRNPNNKRSRPPPQEQEQSPGQARRTDAAPYGMAMDVASSETAGGGGDTESSQGEETTAGTRTRKATWRKSTPERTPRPRASAAAAAASEPKGLVKPLPPRSSTVRRANGGDSKVRRASGGGANVRRGTGGGAAATGAGATRPPGVAVRRRRIRVSVPPVSKSNSSASSPEASGGSGSESESGSATPPPAKRQRQRLRPRIGSAAAAAVAAASPARTPSGGDDGSGDDADDSLRNTKRGGRSKFVQSGTGSPAAPVGRLRGLGPGSVSALAEMGVHTVGDLANMSDGEVDAAKATKPSLKLGHLRKVARTAIGANGGEGDAGGGTGDVATSK